VMPSPGELEARFNSLKRPVNPNAGADTGQVDTSSPPPQHGGIDPTIALTDPDATSTTGTGGTPKLGTAPIDYVPGWESGPPGSWQAGQGTTAASSEAGAAGEPAGMHWP
jgi:hypothetical protein